MFMSPGPIVTRKELKRLAVLKRPNGSILRVAIDQVTDSDGENFHYVTLRPYTLVGPDRHIPEPYTIAVLAGELTELRDALTDAIAQIPAHETVTPPEAA